MHSDLLDWLLRSALASSGAIIVVLSLRRPWLRWLGARSILWLWVLVPALVLAVSLPARTVLVASPVRADAEMLHGVALRAPMQDASRSPSVSVQADSWIERAVALLRSRSGEIEFVVTVLWALGAVIVALHLLRQQRRFLRSFGRLHARADGSWSAETSDFGPVVVGLLQPRIVVPADFEHRYDARQRDLILAHERCHLYRGDLCVNFLLCLLRCVYWFNPLVPMATQRLQFDQDLACDAWVLRCFPHSRRAYADAILNTQLADLGLPVGCYWQSSHPLKWRIIMLTKPSVGWVRVMSGSGLAIIGSTLAAASAWAVLPKYVEVKSAVAMAVDATPASENISVGPVVASQETKMPVAVNASIAPVAVALPHPSKVPMAVIEVSPAVVAIPLVASLSAETVPEVASVSVVRSLASADKIPAVVEPARLSMPGALATERILPALAVRNPHGVGSAPSVVKGALQLASHASPTSHQDGGHVQTNAPADVVELPILLAIDRPRLGLAASRALENGSGLVTVSVELDAEGRPGNVAVADSNLGSTFERSALRAVQAARYAPATKNGIAVSCTALVPVVFSLYESANRNGAHPFTPPQMHKPRYYSQRNGR